MINKTWLVIATTDIKTVAYYLDYFGVYEYRKVIRTIVAGMNSYVETVKKLVHESIYINYRTDSK